MEKTNYVLDTNVVLHDPYAIYSFGSDDVYLPIYVFDELDRFKKELTQRGKSARTIIRQIEDLRKRGNLIQGVPLGEGKGTLYVSYVKEEQRLSIPFESDARLMDNAIVATALAVKEETGLKTIFVTLDVNLRIRAEAMGLDVQDYGGEKKNIDELYTGIIEATVSPDVIDTFYKEREVDLPEGLELYPNQYVIMKSGSQSAIARYDAGSSKLVQLLYPEQYGSKIMGISKRNLEQQIAFDILLNDDLRLVTLVGKAGTGKTLLAIAAGLFKMKQSRYKSMLVSRPVFPMGKELGFLPGDVESKLNPWMQPIFDNMELIALHQNPRPASYRDLMTEYNVLVEPLTYIRGRSLPGQYIIVDEAQNLTPHEVKTIITRCGEGTKIILTGDPYQIDNPYVDSTNNGLTQVVERFKSSAITGHVTLVKGERSKLAELAANLL